MPPTIHLSRTTQVVALLLTLTLPCVARGQITLPADPPPVEQFLARTLHQPPALGGTGHDAQRSVAGFLAWAGKSAPSEREDGRRAIVAAAGNNDVARVLCKEAMKARHRDNSRALLVLAVLGELRSTDGLACLQRILAIPTPVKGMPDRETGEPDEASMLDQQQAKAIDGIAYLRSEVADSIVLDTVAHHPRHAVRGEAIDAYLWNHGDTVAARDALLAIVQPGEDIFVDRVRREDDDSAETFDAKIDTFLRAHPERQGDPPAATTPAGKSETPRDPGQAPIDGFVFGLTCGSSAPLCDGSCPTGQRCVSNPLVGCGCQ